MNAVPNPSAVNAHEVPFHQAHDVAFFHPTGGTAFFRNFRHYWDGRAKLYPDECNLPGEGTCFPRGTLKKVVGISIQAQGAQDDDLFEIDVVISKQKQRTLTIRSGMKEAVYLDPPLAILGQEHFEVHVRAPDRLRADRAYARVTLHGSYSIVTEAPDVKTVDATAVPPPSPPQ